MGKHHKQKQDRLSEAAQGLILFLIVAVLVFGSMIAVGFLSSYLADNPL